MFLQILWLIWTEKPGSESRRVKAGTSLTELINLLASIVNWLAGSAQFVDTQTGIN